MLSAIKPAFNPWFTELPDKFAAAFPMVNCKRYSWSRFFGASACKFPASAWRRL